MDLARGIKYLSRLNEALDLNLLREETRSRHEASLMTLVTRGGTPAIMNIENDVKKAEQILRMWMVILLHACKVPSTLGITRGRLASLTAGLLL
jgi:hypothetical protein